MAYYTLIWFNLRLVHLFSFYALLVSVLFLIVLLFYSIIEIRYTFMQIFQTEFTLNTQLLSQS